MLLYQIAQIAGRMNGKRRPKTALSRRHSCRTDRDRPKNPALLTTYMSSIFGPVPSRRLGRSLGIDVIPPKTCSFDCIYCESGPTTRLSVTGENFVDPSEILAELSAFFRLHPEATDVLTLSGAGEPTLYAGLGELIAAVKKTYPRFPLIVLTNGSLLWAPEVRRRLLKADRVVPSLDAVTPAVFRNINRPHPSLELRADHRGNAGFSQGIQRAVTC